MGQYADTGVKWTNNKQPENIARTQSAVTKPTPSEKLLALYAFTAKSDRAVAAPGEAHSVNILKVLRNPPSARQSSF